MASYAEIAPLNPSVKPMKPVLMLTYACASCWAFSSPAWDAGNEVVRAVAERRALNSGRTARSGGGLMAEAGLRNPFTWTPAKIIVEAQQSIAQDERRADAGDIRKTFPLHSRTDDVASEWPDYDWHHESCDSQVEDHTLEDACPQSTLPSMRAGIIVGFMVFSCSLVNPTALCLLF